MTMQFAKEKENQVQVEQKQKFQPESQSKTNRAGQINIHFYTDPLCCWSWALDHHWRKLRDVYADEIHVRYVMGGMIPDWKTYHDPMNSVSRPIQMGPVWMHASEVTQVKMKYAVWHEDPPASSFPACIAVKTAGLQSSMAEDQYLFHIRRSIMEEGRNIAKSSVIFSVAEALHGPDFNFPQFEKDWNKQNGLAAFREDISKTKIHNIGRYPTITFQNQNGKGLIIVGYRPYDVLDQAMDMVKKIAVSDL